MFKMRKYFFLFTFLCLMLNVYGVKLLNDNVFMNKLLQKRYPQRFDRKVTVEQIRTNQYIDGGITEVDPNDIKYYELAKESLKKYEQDTEAKQHHVLKVTKATEQLVAGLMTRIDFDAALTDPELDGYNAPILKSNGLSVYYCNIITCHSEIWDRPWINSRIIDVTCWE